MKHLHLADVAYRHPAGYNSSMPAHLMTELLAYADEGGAWPLIVLAITYTLTEWKDYEGEVVPTRLQVRLHPDQIKELRDFLSVVIEQERDQS